MGTNTRESVDAGTPCLRDPARVLWKEGDWRCEFNPGLAGSGRLEVYQADQLVLTEETLSGPTAIQRAEILRQRLLRGDLGPTKAPPCPKCGGHVRITGGRAPLLYFDATSAVWSVLTTRPGPIRSLRIGPELMAG
jgi:hypothetical protein